MARKNDDANQPSRDDVRRVGLPDRPDLGLGEIQNSEGDRAQGLSQPETVQRREENPFSFKKFLNQSHGVRRKEYTPDGAPILNTPEMSSVLPDFVQDHLVVEQCYLSSPGHHAHIPFDLPLPTEDRGEPGVSMSLPDFLSDGPIHSQRGDGEAAAFVASNEPSNGQTSSPDQMERLQHEVDSLRRQLQERNRRIHILESEVALLHSRDAQETNSLEYALQQVENNLRQTSKRMVAAENLVIKLKADNKMLKEQLDGIEGQGAGMSSSPSSQFAPTRNARLAQDLRGAASAAEIHLRSLMSGIENLKLLAKAVEDVSPLDSDDVEGVSRPAL